MKGQIRLTPDQMRQRANEYRTQAATVGDVIKKMDSLLNQLQGEWEGNSSEAYVARYNELKPGFIKAQQLIDDIAKVLDTTAKGIESVDTDFASAIRK